MPVTGKAISRCDVLIAGYGPVGATLAALLGQAGLSVIVVEPEQDVYPLPRAAHLDHEIMRILQSIGIIEAIQPYVRKAPDYEFRSASGEVLMRVERDGVIGASGWPVSFNFYQPGVENAIRNVVTALPNVHVLHGARFKEILTNGPDSVVIKVASEGSIDLYTSHFLVGCDGAWSPVREAISVKLDDYAFDEPWLVIDAKTQDESGFPKMNLQLCNPERPTSFVHMGPGRLRWEFMLKPNEEHDVMKSDSWIAALLEPWQRCGDIEVERRAVYRFHGLSAKRWRDGRVFIAGDAAHQMPPFMGQGLCSGLRDAANLAWKLQAVITGRASDGLLDSYQDERDPHVRFVIEKAIEMGRLVCTLDAKKAAARDATFKGAPRIGPPAAFPAMTQGCIMSGTPGAGTIFLQSIDQDSNEFLDDHLGGGAWLLQLSTTVEDRTFVGLAQVNISKLPSSLANPIKKWLEERGVDAVLVRADRYVFGSGSADSILKEYENWFRPASFVTKLERIA